MTANQPQLSRRAMLRLLGITATGAALAACAPVGAPGQGGAPAAGEAAAGPAAETIEVRFWNVWGAAREELMNQIIERFEEENPGITVQNLVQPFEGRAENLFAALNSGDPPEVMMATRAELLKFADDGLLVPITPYVESAGLDLSVFYPSEIGNFYWQDELYSMPMPTGGGVTSLQLVNGDIFAEEGKELVLPATWQELEELAAEFTQLDDRGIVRIGADPGTSVGAFFAWLYCNNGVIYSEDLRSVAFNSEEGVATLDWMVNFANSINGGVQNVTDFFAGPGEATEAQPWYNMKQVVNFPNVSIFFHMQTFTPDMQWDMSVRPHNGANSAAKSQGLSGEEFAWGYVMAQGVAESKREAAFKWIQKITYDEDGGGWFMLQQGRPSPIRSVNEDQSFYDVNQHWDKVIQSLESDVSVPIMPEHTRVRDTVDQAVQAAMFGDLSPADALAQAATQAQAILDEYYASRA
jgi:ABC-type glycerol-3-phosphate transport system substrate-binding protein